jgi:hypothetical protein
LKDDPLNFVGGFHYAAALLAAGDDLAGEAQLRELCDIHPSLYQPFYLLGFSQALRGLHSQALAAAENAHARAPWNTGTIGLLAGALRRTGEGKRADGLLKPLASGDAYGAPIGLMISGLACGEIARAGDWAWKAFQQRDPRLIFAIALLRAPSRNLLQSDARWTALANELRVPLEA